VGAGCEMNPPCLYGEYVVKVLAVDLSLFTEVINGFRF